MKHWIGLVVFICTFLISIFLSSGIGVSWDEPDNIWAAGVYIKFFQSGLDSKILVDKNSSASYFHEKIFTQEPSLNRYPPFPLYIGGGFVLIAERFIGTLSPQQIITAFHAASGFFLAILTISIYYFVLMFGFSITISLVTAAVVMLHPTLFGYGLSIIKDSAQVSLFCLSLLLLVKATQSNRKSLLIIGTLVWGAAMATKINALYVPVIWGVWTAVVSIRYQVSRIKHLKQTHTTRYIIQNTLTKELIGKVVLPLFIVVVGGLIVMVILWPYLWFDPVSRMQEVFRYFTTVGTGYKVFWNGSFYQTGRGVSLPWYPLVHIFIGTPIPILVLSFLGFVSLIFRLLKRDYTSFQWLLLLALWIGIPLMRTFRPDAAFYDGMRHFLEVLPAFLLLSPWGLLGLSKTVARKLGNERYTTAIVSLSLVLYLIMVIWNFSPYSAGYVNAFIRNPNDVVERDFAGVSIAEAVRKAHIHRPQPSRIFVPIGGHLSWYYLTQGDLYVYTLTDSDVLILINKPSHILKSQFDAEVSDKFELKDVVYRGNNIFAWIYVKR